MKAVYQAVATALRNQQPVIVATIVESQGSTPRKAGAKMAIFQDGTVVGSVGGGAVEAAVMQHADELWSQGGAVLKAYILNDRKAANLGMICGGNQQILTTLIPPDPEQQGVFQTLAAEHGGGNQGYLITQLQGEGPEFSRAQAGLLDRQGVLSGYSLNPPVLEALTQDLGARRFPLLKYREGHTFLVEKIHSQGTVFIFGAGHVAQPTMALAAMVGFQTVVLDDRVEFANTQNFPRSDQIIVLQNFEDALAKLAIADDSYLIIVTRGHAHDQTILEQALGTSAAYIGMIGSQIKVARCLANMKQQGFTEVNLARVHAPIGLDIGSDTPEEIAVSIIAELIQVRARLKGKKFRGIEKQPFL